MYGFLKLVLRARSNSSLFGNLCILMSIAVMCLHFGHVKVTLLLYMYKSSRLNSFSEPHGFDKHF